MRYLRLLMMVLVLFIAGSAFSQEKKNIVKFNGLYLGGTTINNLENPPFKRRIYNLTVTTNACIGKLSLTGQMGLPVGRRPRAFLLLGVEYKIL